MTDNIARLPYTLSELQSLLARLNTIDNEFDGSWVTSFRSIGRNPIAPIGNPEDPSKEIVINIADYLPNDQFLYKVLLTIGSVQTFMTVHTSVQTGNFWCQDANEFGSSVVLRTFAEVIVGLDRNISLRNYGQKSGYYEMELLGYQRLGKHPVNS